MSYVLLGVWLPNPAQRGMLPPLRETPIHAGLSSAGFGARTS